MNGYLIKQMIAIGKFIAFGRETEARKQYEFLICTPKESDRKEERKSNSKERQGKKEKEHFTAKTSTRFYRVELTACPLS